MPCWLVTVLAVAAWVAPAQAAKVPCSYDGYPRARCGLKMPSYSSAWIRNDATHCSAPRHFWALDRSKRVNLVADAKWIAPGKMRMRAWGPSELGPLRVTGQLRGGGKITFRNRSAFPVWVGFFIDCP